ncbi:hypothetical protein PAECIP112173_01222 [Paenibacillus sp. JJ-100]|nr:hypothetical protein PAECIP112173_01222 [Paenibacillus sp. JJ-100]
MTEELSQQKQELSELIKRHSLLNGAIETAIPSLFCYHSKIGTDCGGR